MSLTREELIQKINALNEAKDKITKHSKPELEGDDRSINIRLAYLDCRSLFPFYVPSDIMVRVIAETISIIDKELECLYHELGIILGCGED